MNGPRILLADQLLRDGIGHHLGYNLAIADAALRAGRRPALVVHREFAANVPDGASVCRLFRTDHRANPPFWAAGNHRLLGWLERRSARRFASDLGRFPAVAGEDIVFAQMLAPRHFVAWLEWLRACPAPPVLFLQLGYRPERFAAPEVRRALGNMSREERRRILLVTDSEKLCTAFGEVLRETVHYLPHVVPQKIPLNRREPPPGGTVNVFVPGNARREKGFAEVWEAARIISSSGESDHFKFTVQCHRPDLACARLLRTRRREAGIEWIDRALDDGEYMERLGRADIVLLPYHLDCYAARTSGIFAEARVAGIPVVTTRGSWAGDRVEREGGGWLAPERDARGLASVLSGARRSLAKTKSEALVLAGPAREEFERDGFVQRLLALLPANP